MIGETIVVAGVALDTRTSDARTDDGRFFPVECLPRVCSAIARVDTSGLLKDEKDAGFPVCFFGCPEDAAIVGILDDVVKDDVHGSSSPFLLYMFCLNAFVAAKTAFAAMINNTDAEMSMKPYALSKPRDLPIFLLAF